MVVAVPGRLSAQRRLEALQKLIHRDAGFFCFYCKKELSLESYVLDHLNCNPNDNRIENQVITCQSCNIKKAFDSELRERAIQKLRENESRTQQNNRIEDQTSAEHDTEISINEKNFPIVEKYISETITADGFIEYSKALNSCAYVCRKKTSHGAQQTIRNYIDMLTSDEGPFMVIRNENGKKIIVRRSSWPAKS